jgi:hypothetical protein
MNTPSANGELHDPSMAITLRSPAEAHALANILLTAADEMSPHERRSFVADDGEQLLHGMALTAIECRLLAERLTDSTHEQADESTRAAGETGNELTLSAETVNLLRELAQRADQGDDQAAAWQLVGAVLAALDAGERK